MTRDALIEALAKAQYESVWGYEDHTPWEKLHPDTRATVRDVIRSNGWPLIVEFVAGWIEDWCGNLCSPEAYCLLDDWRKDMAS